MTLGEAFAALLCTHLACGYAVWRVTRDRRDRHWRAKLKAQDRAWARAFARIPKPLRRYTLESIFGGLDREASE